MSHQADMSHTSSPPKRPRLSLQIKTPSAPMTLNKSSTALKADIDPSSPTAFNTLSNAYAAAISLASPLPMSAAPVTATSFSASSARPKSLRLVTSGAPQSALLPSHRIQTPGPFTVVYPDTPTTQAPTPVTAHPDVSLQAPFTFTPPQSAHPSSPTSTVSTGTNTTTIAAAAATTTATTSRLRRINVSIPTLAPSPFPSSPRTPRRRATTGSTTPYKAPYTHPRSLRSILRNSPLPARTAGGAVATTVEKGGRRVGYNNPLTQTITTELYIRSHVELLGEDDAVPDGEGAGETETGIEAVLAYDGATRDGGQTPGPFEEMRRRMAGLGEDGGRKKRKREKKRAWVWTIGVGEGEEEEGGEKMEKGEEEEGEGGLELLRPSTYVPMMAIPTVPMVIVAPPIREVGVRGGEMEVDPPERPMSSQSI
ncbi:hypothetical protein VF21_07370 [Pseudogymnoascus sp. 05NY08]|nr:hypothetical protein VF21_07370 [Pseudogymnoascus sp. 05NY08]